ncbi:MAG: alpha/beta hydrolase [Candidatus Schekmanbacteria bacterium]|nr:alpha/beta hydrolase [Candidatus Schekmanbacteria bacterium]
MSAQRNPVTSDLSGWSPGADGPSSRSHESTSEGISALGRPEPGVVWTGTGALGQGRGLLSSLLAAGAGLCWLALGQREGIVWAILSAIPGGLLLAAGMASALWSGDLRIRQYGVLGAVLGTTLALMFAGAASVPAGLVLFALSLGAGMALAAAALRGEPRHAGVPVPEPSAALAAQVALDELVLSTMHLTIPVSLRETDWCRIRREVEQAVDLFAREGWLDSPESYHRVPAAPSQFEVRVKRAGGMAFEHVRFASDYRPWPDEPGASRWLSYAPNRTAHAWLLRHHGGARPWLICLHGYQMGTAAIDLRLFRAEWLKHRAGFNVAFPVLPLHGPRKIGRRSGDGYLSGDFLDTLHAQTQALWDIRRLLCWIRELEPHAPLAPAVFGLSLGGYNAALLAAHVADLSAVIAGIPATDFVRLFWRHGTPHGSRLLEHVGLSREPVSRALSLVSPLALPAKVERENLFVFGGVADRLVPPDQIRDLWEHWNRPQIAWYQGGHLTFPADTGVRRMIRMALSGAGATVQPSPTHG